MTQGHDDSEQHSLQSVLHAGIHQWRSFARINTGTLQVLVGIRTYSVHSDAQQESFKTQLIAHCPKDMRLY
jgi:hypothetical protein